MGAWGYGPFDNDTACDYRADWNEGIDPFGPFIPKPGTLDCEDIWIAMAAYLLDNPPLEKKFPKIKLVLKIALMQINPAYYKEWDDSESRKEVVDDLIKYLS